MRRQGLVSKERYLRRDTAHAMRPASRFRTIPLTLVMFWYVLACFVSDQNIPEHAKTYQNIPKHTRTYQNIPEHAKTYQNMSTVICFGMV